SLAGKAGHKIRRERDTGVLQHLCAFPHVVLGLILLDLLQHPLAPALESELDPHATSLLHQLADLRWQVVSPRLALPRHSEILPDDRAEDLLNALFLDREDVIDEIYDGIVLDDQLALG